MLSYKGEHFNTLLLGDHNGEYAIPKTPGGAYNIEEIFNRFDLENIFGEEAVEELLKHVPEELNEDFSYIWLVEGMYSQLLVTFNAFCRKVMADKTGGDDDTFDYWPSAMHVLQQFANDLDKINPDNKHYEQLRQAYLNYITTFGRVPEYHFDDTDIIPEEASKDE